MPEDSGSLTTVQGYLLSFISFALLVAMCVHFQNETSMENKRNQQMIKDSYRDEDAASKEMSLLASFALQRHSVSPHALKDKLSTISIHEIADKIENYSKVQWEGWE